MGTDTKIPTLPRILVIGGTGTSGRKVVEYLEQHSKDVVLRYSSRRPEQIAEWTKQGRNSVLLDLDDPTTFPLALHGVDRILLITTYTVAMLAQSKTLVDAAKKAGVQHIVHLGAFGNWDTSIPVFLWHQLVEVSIEASGLAWTHLKPNMFMELVLTPGFLSGSQFLDSFGGQRIGWVAADTIANAAATILREGPAKHNAKSYFLSTEVLTGQEMVKILNEVLGKTLVYKDSSGEGFSTPSDVSGAVQFDVEYGKSGAVLHDQINDGRMGYIGTVRDDGPHVTGKTSLGFRDWVVHHKPELLRLMDQHQRVAA